jgi:triosephosphate isomerase
MNSGRARLVAGNWKMHGSLGVNQRLLEALKASPNPAMGLKTGFEAAVCVPFPYLAQVSALLSGSGIGWGAQTLSEHDAGAYTGEVSGAMLKEFGWLRRSSWRRSVMA